MTPQEAEQLRKDDANAWGNKATADWRNLPDATGKTHWQYEEEKRTGVVAATTTVRPAQKKMTVAAIPVNKRLVEAYDENQVRGTVDVGNNTNFAIGDEITVGPHESGYADVWTLLSGTPKDNRRPTTEGATGL